MEAGQTKTAEIITKSNHKAKNPVSDMNLRGYIRQWQREGRNKEKQSETTKKDKKGPVVTSKVARLGCIRVQVGKAYFSCKGIASSSQGLI